MIPGPAPVTTIQPALGERGGDAAAWAYSGSSGAVRAEPKTVTFGTSR